MLKKALGIALVSVLAFSSINGVAKANSEVINKDSVYCIAGTASAEFNGKIEESFTGEFTFTFEDFSKDFKKGLSTEVLKEAKVLFNKATKLEEQNKYEDAIKVWNKLAKLNLFDEQLMVKTDYEPMSFNELKESFKSNLNADTLSKAKSIYEKVVKYEKSGELDKANEEWNKLYSLNVFSDFEVGTVKYTFEDLKKEFKKGAKKEDIEKAQKLFSEITQLEDKSKFEEADKLWNKLYSLNLFDDKVYAEVSFEDFAKLNLKEMNEKETQMAKELYNKMTAFEKKGNYEEADKIWQEFDKLNLVKDYEVCLEDKFDNYTHMLRENVSKETLNKAKAVFEKMVALELKGKFEEASKLWDEILEMKVFNYPEKGVTASTEEGVTASIK